MDKKKQEFIRFSTILPEELEVEIHRAEEGGFWAQIKNLPGCNTQGENFFDLIDMINDAVFTYFEVPERLRKDFLLYVPKFSPRAREKVLHEKMEEVIREIIQNKGMLEFSRA
ncbi:MAG: type II toxin-antitoxin system HicB family antitoxin [Patescibacteria group bacterium]